MDNASKALIFAGAILLTVLIISLTMYALNTYKKFTEDMSNLTKSVQDEAFNRFFVYSETDSGRIKRFEAYNIINKIIDINSEPDTNSLITLVFNGATHTSIDDLRSDANSILDIDNINEVNAVQYKEDNMTYGYTYGNDGRVNRIIING